MGTPRIVANGDTAIWKWDLFGPIFGDGQVDEDPDNNRQIFRFALRFPGQQYDRVSKLHYNYFRDYEPGTGRYVESDPIGLDGGLSTYSYAYLNPTLYVDPTGQQAAISVPVLCGVAICFATGVCQRALQTAAQGINDYMNSNSNDCVGPIRETVPMRRLSKTMIRFSIALWLIMLASCSTETGPYGVEVTYAKKFMDRIPDGCQIYTGADRKKIRAATILLAEIEAAEIGEYELFASEVLTCGSEVTVTVMGVSAINNERPVWYLSRESGSSQISFNRLPTHSFNG